MEFEHTSVFVNRKFYCHFGNSKEALGVAGLGHSHVSSLTGYRSMSAVFVQP